MNSSHGRQLKDVPALAVTALNRGSVGAKYLVASCRTTIRLAHLASRDTEQQTSRIQRASHATC